MPIIRRSTGSAIRRSKSCAAALDIGYFRPGEVIIERGKPSEHLHVIIKGAVEERDGEELEAVLGPKDSFDARALVHGAAGASFVAAEETLCYLAPKALVLDLIRRNPALRRSSTSEIVPQARVAHPHARRPRASTRCCARASATRGCIPPCSSTAAPASLRPARIMQRARHQCAVRPRRRAHRRRHRHEPVEGGRCSIAAPLDTQVRDICHFDIVAVDVDDFIFEALIKMTRHNKRRLAVRSNGEYVGMLEDIDILGLVAGNSQLIPGRIDRARTVDDLAAPAARHPGPGRAAGPQGVKVEVIAEITSDLNRAPARQAVRTDRLAVDQARPAA